MVNKSNTIYNSLKLFFNRSLKFIRKNNILIDYTNRFQLFIGSNSHIYIVYTAGQMPEKTTRCPNEDHQIKTTKCLQIPGNFDDLFFVNWMSVKKSEDYPNSIIIAGCDRGNISYYMIQIDHEKGQFR